MLFYSGLSCFTLFIAWLVALWRLPSRRRLLLRCADMVTWPVLTPLAYVVCYWLTRRRRHGQQNQQDQSFQYTSAYTEPSESSNNRLLLENGLCILEKWTLPYLACLNDPEAFQEYINYYVPQTVSKVADAVDDPGALGYIFKDTMRLINNSIEVDRARRLQICAREILSCRMTRPTSDSIASPITLEPLAKLMAEYAYGPREQLVKISKPRQVRSQSDIQIEEE